MITPGPDLEFEDFFRACYPRLASALMLMTGDAADAEDLAQEALTRAYERWARVRLMASPLGYVFRTANNLNRKRIRRVRTRSRHASPDAPGGDPMEAMQARVEVREALDSLPTSQREVLILVEWLGLDTETVGQLMGIAPVSVRGRLHRARQTLRQRFGGTDE